MYKCDISCQLTCMFTTNHNAQTSSATITMYAAEMETTVEITNLDSQKKDDATRSPTANSI